MTELNAGVDPIHPSAMPVIRTTPVEVDFWLAADAPRALELNATRALELGPLVAAVRA